jgi:hypothetical protein
MKSLVARLHDTGKGSEHDITVFTLLSYTLSAHHEEQLRYADEMCGFHGYENLDRCLMSWRTALREQTWYLCIQNCVSLELNNARLGENLVVRVFERRTAG